MGWQWAFYVNVPIGAALVALVARVIESSKDPDATRLDLPGVASFASALFLATLALIEGNRRGWGDPWILAEGAAALILFGLFIFVEQNRARPMLELSYFRKPTYFGANLAQLSFSAGMLTMLTFVPMFLQSGLGRASASAGLMMLPMVVPLFVVPRIVTNHLAHRFSGRTLLSAGLFLICLALFWLSFAVQQVAYVPLIGGMLLAGIGAGLLNGETTKVGMTVIPRERSGMASGVSGTVRFSGLVIGIAALGGSVVRPRCHRRKKCSAARHRCRADLVSAKHHGREFFGCGPPRPNRVRDRNSSRRESRERVSCSVLSWCTIHARLDHSNLAPR